MGEDIIRLLCQCWTESLDNILELIKIREKLPTVTAIQHRCISDEISVDGVAKATASDKNSFFENRWNDSWKVGLN